MESLTSRPTCPVNRAPAGRGGPVSAGTSAVWGLSYIHRAIIGLQLQVHVHQVLEAHGSRLEVAHRTRTRNRNRQEEEEENNMIQQE